MYAHYSLSLPSGRIVRLNDFHVSRTYSGLLEGVPDTEYNNKIMAIRGYALAPLDERDAEELLKRADAGMYAGKQAGRNCMRRGGVT